MKRIIIIAVVLLVLGLGGAGYWYLHASAARAGSFRTEPAVQDDITATITATGTLEPEDVIDIGSQVVGQVKEFGTDKNGKLVDFGSVVEGSRGYPAAAGMRAYPSAVLASSTALMGGPLGTGPWQAAAVVRSTKEGTVLARIDDAIYRAQVDSARARLNSAEMTVDSKKAQLEVARANVAQAEANVTSAKANKDQSAAHLVQSDNDWQRARTLGVPTLMKADYDAFKATYEMARADVGVKDAAIKQMEASLLSARASVGDAQAAVKTAEAAILDAQAQLNQAEVNLGYCTIVSNVDGVIIDRRVTLGQTIVSSFNTTSMFLVARDLKRMTIWASVNEADIGHVFVGQKVNFTVDARPNETFHGVVRLVRLNATMTNNVVTYTVEVTVDNSSGKLLPYLTANMTFEVEKSSHVLQVPNSALRYKPQPAQMEPATRQKYLEAQQRKQAQSAASGGDKPAAADAKKEKENRNQGLVWVESNGYARPVRLKIGLSDGNNTEVLQVLDGELKDGDKVIVGEAAKGGGSDTSNPFAPQMFGGNKK